jgi:hypothetical protein
VATTAALTLLEARDVVVEGGELGSRTSISGDLNCLLEDALTSTYEAPGIMFDSPLQFLSYSQPLLFLLLTVQARSSFQVSSCFQNDLFLRASAAVID